MPTEPAGLTPGQSTREFNTPSLFNIHLTAPFFHDGSVETLPEAVRMMGRYQVGEELADDEVQAIVAWLGALSGDLPTDYIARPALPDRTAGAGGR